MMNDALDKVAGSLTNPFQYTAREFDSETSLYYYRARYYDPTVGRFISEDPARFQSGTNFYPYVDNTPLNAIDPTGRNLCFEVTPRGMTEVPCADPKGGMSCIDVPGGVSCVVPIPPGPPPGIALSSAGDSMSAPGCKCDPVKLYNEGQKILLQQQGKDLGVGVGAAGTSAALQVVEKILGKLGESTAEMIPILDLLLLANDAREMLDHGAEAREKLRKLYGPCLH